MATIKDDEKSNYTPGSPDQTGASGAYSNSAIAMMPPGQAVSASERERVLGVKIARAMFFPAEPLQEFIGICWVGEAVNVKPLSVVKDGVPPAAYRQILAKLVNLLVPVAALTARWEGDLMGPAPVNARWRQLALAAHL
jgi:hypothetical protein